MKRVLLFAGIGFLVLTIIIIAVTLISRRQPKQTSDMSATLTIWRYGDDEAVFKPLIQEFQTDNPNVKIEYVKKDLQNYEADSTNALASGTGPDIWSIPNDWLPRHSDKLIPAPDTLFQANRRDKTTAAQVVKDRFVPIVSQETIIDNKLYGLPLSLDTLALYVNRPAIQAVVNDKFNKSQEVDDVLLTDGPQTWDEMVKFVKGLNSRTKDAVERSVVAMGSGSNIEVSPDLLGAIMLQNKTQMLSPDGLTSGFNLPATKSTGATFNPGKEALDFYTSFANPLKETFTWQASFPASQQAFLDGKTMMAFGYSDFGRTLSQLKPDLQFRIVPLPQIAGSRNPVDFASYPVETVTNNAESPETAWAFIQFLATTGLQDYLATTERPSPLKVETPPLTIQDRLGAGSPFKFQAQSAVTWPRGKNPDKVESLFRQMIDDVVVRNINSQQAIDGAAKQITEVIRQAAGFKPASTEGQ